MSTTIIAMYDNADKAQQVADEVVRAGINKSAVDVLRGGNGSSSTLVGNLTERGVEEQEASIYADEIAKGGFMVAVDAPDETAKDACEIMNRLGARDLEQLTAEAAGSRSDQDSVPVVEERVAIGKRKVLRGGMRVTSTVSERPIEETVRLREETVAVEKHGADRKLSPEEAEKAFQQNTVELTESAEEAVISKEAHVVEEVSLSKTAAEREETVQTTARRTDVKVEEIDLDKAQPRKR